MKKVVRVVLAIALASWPGTAMANTLVVPDASQLEWSISYGKVYFRNFNTIDPTWQGCCYAYYIDLATDEGKAMFSVFLTRHTARQRLNFWVDNKSANPSRIVQMGDW
jgi:hypothetical protein